MLNENILNEMTQRPQEKTGKFLSRQQMARNVIREINALEVRLMHLMADEEIRGKIGGTIRTGNMNENRTQTTRKAEESVSSIA